jgi:hypothetical protein
MLPPPPASTVGLARTFGLVATATREIAHAVDATPRLATSRGIGHSGTDKSVS